MFVPLALQPASGRTPSSARAIPATALLDRQIVEVRGEGFAPYDYVSVSECAGRALDPARCAGANFGGADGSGRLSVDVMVRRVLTVAGSQRDCALAPCFLVLSTGGAALPLRFARGAPLVRAALPAQAKCVPWPTTQWPTGPIPPGVDPNAVADTGRQMLASGATSVVVVYAGRVVYEDYAAGHGPNVVEPSFSMSKSFTSTVIGLLVQQGKLHLDARAPVREWSGASDPHRAITLRNILNMSSGLQWNEIYSDVPGSDVMQMVLREPDEAAYVIAKPLAHAPGTYWNYSTGDTAVLGRIISRTVHVAGPSYEQYLHTTLLDPLGITPVSIGFDQTGDWAAGWSTNMSTRNFAKLGLLYLRNGVWAGSQFLSPKWVEFVRTPSPADAGYGGQFWLQPDGSFRMVGLYGQAVHIVPQSDLIVAVSNGGSTQQMVDLFRHAVPPSCGVRAPVVRADRATIANTGPASLPVLANDTGGTVGLAARTLTVANLPAKGTATVVGARIRYTPRRGAVGADQFSYVVCTNDRRRCLEANVALTIH